MYVNGLYRPLPKLYIIGALKTIERGSSQVYNINGTFTKKVLISVLLFSRIETKNTRRLKTETDSPDLGAHVSFYFQFQCNNKAAGLSKM